MHPLAIFAVINVLVYCFIYYISAPPTFPGSAGVAGFIWFALTGQVLGAVIAYFVTLGRNSDVDLEIESKLIELAAGSVAGALLFLTYTYGVISGDGHTQAHLLALGETVAVQIFGAIGVVVVMLLLIVSLLASPFLLFFGAIGLIKYSIFWANRPDAMDAVASGENFDFKSTMDDLENRTEYTPPSLLAFVFPGVTNWYMNTRIYWNDKIVETYKSGAQAARATRTAYEDANRDKD